MSELKPKKLPPVPSEADVLRRMKTPPNPHVEKTKQMVSDSKERIGRQSKRRKARNAAIKK